jgi:hypothetical protein
VFIERIGEQPKGAGVASLIFTDTVDDVALVRIIGEIYQSAVGQLGAGLQGNIELAVPVEGLVAEFLPEHPWDPPCEAGSRNEKTGGPSTKGDVRLRL